MLEEGAKDFRLHLGPVVIGGFAEQDEFLVEQLQPGRLGKEAAVEVGDVLEPATAGSFAGVFVMKKLPQKAFNIVAQVLAVVGGVKLFF